MTQDEKDSKHLEKSYKKIESSASTTKEKSVSAAAGGLPTKVSIKSPSLSVWNVLQFPFQFVVYYFA